MTTGAQAPSLNECRSFTRGYLLACDWAGRRPTADAAERVPRLAGEGITALYDSFRLLPRPSREAMRITWSKRERRCRLDEQIEIHPSWLTDHLAEESAATLLVALGEIHPELGREVLRSLWPRVKPRTGDEVEVRPLAPAWSGELRRWLFRKFVHAAQNPLREGPAERLAALDARTVWLLVQDIGRDELARVAEAAPGEVDSLLRRLPTDQAVLLSRLLETELKGALPDAGTDTMRIVLPIASSEDRDVLGSEEFQAAAEHIRTVLEMAEPESNAIESVGLRSLAATLADFPRDVALRIAHKMGMPMGMQLLSWRDQLERSGKGNPRSRNEEILRKAGEMAADRQTRAGRSNRRAGEPS